MIATAIYNALLAIIIFGWTGYAIFVQDRSGWWFLGAVCAFYVCSMSYRQRDTSANVRTTEDKS